MPLVRDDRSGNSFRRAAWSALVLCLIAGCDRNAKLDGVAPRARPEAEGVSSGASKSPSVDSPIRFRDVRDASKIDFVHRSGFTEQRLNPTANGSGVAVLDYDGDGRMDLYFCTTNLLPLEPEPKGQNRLFRNLGDNTFRDVTADAGVGFRGFSHGAVAGDLDNDGDPDLIVCNFGPNVVYLNEGNGRFRDVSQASGMSRATVANGDSPNWSSGGALIDYDNDGDLDVYVANYADWSYDRDKDKYCGHPEKKVRLYCGPKLLRTTRHDLWRNEGLRDGVPVFVDVTEKAGVGRTDGHGFAAVAVDLNRDGKLDLNVANDQCPAFTFLNNGDGTFRDVTESSGAAYDDKGQALSGMGVDSEDLDGDGLPELLRTHFSKEYNTIHQNLGDGQFSDRTPTYGINMDSMPYVGWGCVLTDFDNDGWPDCFVTNGHTDNNYHLLGRTDEPFEQPPLLHRSVPYRKGRRLVMVNASAGPYFTTNHLGRGVAQADLDDDGRIDLIVNHMDAPPAILRNESLGDNHWIRLNLRGTKSNRDAIGAKLEISGTEKTIFRQKKGGVSLASSHDPRILVGIGKADEVKVTITWPSGAKPTVLEHVKAGTTTEVVEPAD